MPEPPPRATSLAGPSLPARERRASGSAGATGRILRIVGPGVITGAADDDPSGIVTYSIAGAQLGTAMLWTALLTWPLMAVVQLTCARVGMVTGAGLTRALKRKLPRSVIIACGAALLAANAINIGADLAGMADAAVALVGGSRLAFSAGFGVAIAATAVLCPYRRFAAVLKWLVISLAAYVVTAFITRPDWSHVWHDLLIPRWPEGHAGWSTLVALLGTTISPYLFFWQSSQEVEEEKSLGRGSIPQRAGATPRELTDRTLDVAAGTFFSNLVMFFVILTCATTLHRHGATHIETARDAAAALRPLAGEFATALYTFGIIGVGLLAIPTLAGSSAYVFAETFNWRQGLDETATRAPKFYLLVIGSVAAGIAFTLLGFNPVRALFWTAIVNGVLAPVVLLGLLLVARDPTLMHGQPASRLTGGVVALAMVLMAAAAVGMVVF